MNKFRGSWYRKIPLITLGTSRRAGNSPTINRVISGFVQTTRKSPFRKIIIEKKNFNCKRLYLTKPSDCKDCPFRTTCIGKSPERRITITYFNDEYVRAIARVNSKNGRYLKGKRQSTVQPVFGTLTQFLGLRKINTLGIRQANKVMLTVAMAYNLKKYLKFEFKRVMGQVKEASLPSVLSFFKAKCSINAY